MLINATVHCVSARRTVFPWTIIAVDPPDSDYFKGVCIIKKAVVFHNE